MKNWTIAKRIITGGALILGLLFLVGSIGVYGLRTIKGIVVANLQQDALPGLITAGDMQAYFLRGHIRLQMIAEETDPAVRASHLEHLANDKDKLAKAMGAYEPTIFADDDRKNFGELKGLVERYSTARDGYLTLLKSGKPGEAHAYDVSTLYPSYIAARTQLDKVIAYNQDNANKAGENIVSVSQRATNAALSVAVISMVLGLAIGGVIIRGVNRTLQNTVGFLEDASSQVAAAATQVSSSSQSLAEGASEQAASLEETSSSLEELSSMTIQNNENAQSAKQLSGETRGAAETGNRDMEDMRKAMNAIKTSSNDISKIIKSIDEIAFQTNILALNAAVEAARAGEAGAGFAVVAEEVRALAQRSAASAKETASKIEVAIQSGDQGGRISDKVALSLEVIVEKARKVDELVANIASASQQQKEGLVQINTAVSQMDKVTQANAGSAEETAAAAEELNAQSASLKETVVELKQLVGGAAKAPSLRTQEPKSKPAPRGKAQAASSASQMSAHMRPSPSRKVMTPELAGATNGSHDGEFFKD